MPSPYSARQILKTLGKAGFVVVSQRGSHIKLRKIMRTEVFTVIVPYHKQIAHDTFTSILRQAKLTKTEFEKYKKS